MDAITASPTEANGPFTPFLNPPSRMLIKYAMNADTARNLVNSGFRMEVRTAEQQTKVTDQRIANAEAQGRPVETRVSTDGHLIADEGKKVEVRRIELSMLIVDCESYGFEQVDCHVLKRMPNTGTTNVKVKVEGRKEEPNFFFVIDMRPGHHTGWPTAEARQEALWLLGKPMKFCHIWQNPPDWNVTVNAGHLMDRIPEDLKALRLGLDGKFSLGKHTLPTMG